MNRCNDQACMVVRVLLCLAKYLILNRVHMCQDRPFMYYFGENRRAEELYGSESLKPVV